MATINLKVKGQVLSLPFPYTQIVADSQNYLYAQFAFSSDWDGAAKTAVFSRGEAAYHVLLAENRCLVPHEVIKSPGFTVSVFGGDLITANKITVPVIESGMAEGVTPPEPTPDIYNQLVETVASEKEAAQAAKTAAETSAAEAKKSQEAAAGSADDAKSSETTASQAMTDLLAMMGTDIATLVGGKVPMEQIPATATQEIYVVTDESELTGLTAQRGDLAELIEEISGEPTITKTWQCLGDASKRENWVIWGTSYAVQAGSATTAQSAENAVQINGHRVVVFATRAQYEAAAKDPNTLYLVGDVE